MSMGVTNFKSLGISLDQLNKDNSKTFEEFSVYICQKKVITTTRLLLKELGIIIWLTPQEFLSSFLICRFNSDMMMLDESQNLINAAVELTNSFETYINRDQSIRIKNSLTLASQKYLKLFKQWKSIDSNKIIIDFLKTHYELDNMLKLIKEGRPVEEKDTPENTPDKKIWEKEIMSYQSLIRKKLRKIGGIPALSRLSRYGGEFNEDIGPFYQQVKDVAETAFWQIFSDELEEDPPNLGRIPKLLREIRDLLCSLTPHNSKLCAETYKNLDIELIQQMADHNAMDGGDLLRYSHFILYRIRMLESPSEDKETDKLIRSIGENIQKINKMKSDGTSEPEETFSTVLPWLFKEIFDRVLFIKKQAEEFHKITKDQYRRKKPKVI